MLEMIAQKALFIAISLFVILNYGLLLTDRKSTRLNSSHYS